MGPLKDNLGRATCGGVLKNHLGNWIISFTKNLGICSTYVAELWGIVKGLQLAWQKGFRNMILEVDLGNLISKLQDRKKNEAELSLYLQCLSLLERSWQVKLKHTPREGNNAANWMANLGI